MSDRLRWGVLGAGQIAGVFCHAMRFSRTSEVRLIGSTSLSRAGAIAQRSARAPHSIHCEEDYERVIQSDELDAVYIATLNHQHYPLALASLEAGKHTLVEKPITLREEELRELIEVASRQQVFLMEGFMYRCHPQLATLAAHLKRGDVGQVTMIRAQFGYQASFEPNGRLFQRHLGGGALYDVGCYPTSMAIWVARQLNAHMPPYPSDAGELEVTGRVGRAGVDEEGALCYHLASGARVELRASISEALPPRVLIEGTAGSVLLKEPWLPSSPCRVAAHPLPLDHSFKPSEVVIERHLETGSIRSTQWISADRDLFTYEIDHFAGCVAGVHPSLMPLRDSLDHICLLERWRRGVYERSSFR